MFSGDQVGRASGDRSLLIPIEEVQVYACSKPTVDKKHLLDESEVLGHEYSKLTG